MIRHNDFFFTPQENFTVKCVAVWLQRSVGLWNCTTRGVILLHKALCSSSVICSPGTLPMIFPQRNPPQLEFLPLYPKIASILLLTRLITSCIFSNLLNTL